MSARKHTKKKCKKSQVRSRTTGRCRKRLTPKRKSTKRKTKRKTTKRKTKSKKKGSKKKASGRGRCGHLPESVCHQSPSCRWVSGKGCKNRAFKKHTTYSGPVNEGAASYFSV